MKSRHPLIVTGALAFALNCSVASAQDAPADFDAVREEARELMAAIGDYSADQRDEAIEATQDTLDRLDSNIEAMEERMREQWSSMDAAAREKARKSMSALRRERNELAQWYGAMKNSSGGAWDEMKSGFSDAFDSLGDAWDRAVAEFRD